MQHHDNYKTEQEQFWAGAFGDEYVDRNQGDRLLISNTAFFAKLIANTYAVHSVIEFGANIGLNLMAIKRILPNAMLSAIEINQKAVQQLMRIGGVQIYPMSILDFVPDTKRDLTLIKGVLIHINPEVLPQVYEVLYQSSNRYICIAEYYNPTPVEVTYRGHTGKLFKRDFAGEMLDRYQDLRLLDYGFVYHRDNNFPQDDMNWVLMEKIHR